LFAGRVEDVAHAGSLTHRPPQKSKGIKMICAGKSIC
jgi:hypothetical protein